MNVLRSIVCGVEGPCKTESSQKPVPVHPMVLEALAKWKEVSRYIGADDWVFASRRHRGRRPIWGQAILRKYIRPVAHRVGIQKRVGWHTFRHTYSTLLRSRHRVQSDAGAVTAFLVTIHIGRLYAGDLARKACGTGSSARAGIRL